MEPESNNDASGSGNPKEEATSNKDFKKKCKDLSEEDLALKQQLELDVQRIQDADLGLQKAAIERVRQEIWKSTTSMTSVPKPLKFLRSHYGTLKSFFKTMGESSDSKKLLADILSVLALTMSAEGDRESLKYRLLGSQGDVDFWGHAYVRNLAGEIAQEYAKRVNEKESVDDLIQLVKQIVAFHMKHNAEHEAVDLVMEVEFPQILLDSVDSTNYKRTCIYLTYSTRYLPEPDGEIQSHLDIASVLEIAYKIYIKFEDYPRALQIALFLDNMQHVKQIFTSCPDILRKKQFCSILARHGVSIEVDEKMCGNEEDREALQEIVNNAKLSEGYLTLARDLEVMDPKSPEDIYKEEMLDEWSSDDSATQNLAAAFVNAFVNAGFGQDTSMTVPSDASSGSTSGNWFFKNTGHGKASAAASLGMIYLWDVDAGLAQIDKYWYSKDNQVIAGALLGVGIVNCGVKNECDPALALLADYLDKEDSSIRIGAITGLAFAYAGTQNKQICDKLIPILGDTKAPSDVVAFTAIALGLVYVGSCNQDVAQALMSAVITQSELDLDHDSGDPLTPLLPLGLSLIYLGKKDRVGFTFEDGTEFRDKMTSAWFVTLQSCAYAGTGDKAMVKYCLKRCKKQSGDKFVEAYQGPAVLGVAMVAMAEEIGADMAIRLLEHLLTYGKPHIRKAVPLALALLCISNPAKVHVVDTLSRLTHDDDTQVAMTAVISLGLIGAGTNNARIAGMLRNLSLDFDDLLAYDNNQGFFFCVSIALGLVHMGKGLLTLDPYHSERFLLSPKALAGLVVFLHACLNMKAIILGKYHYVLYFLVLAMQPRMLLTVDENLKPLSVPVQVGKAVDVVGQPGQPKTITGFQTHSTPVLLAAGDRAELATDKYIPLSDILEGFVILRENPNYRKEA